MITVGRERFRVRLRPRHGPRYEYDYDWLTGPNNGYGFGVSGPFEHSDDDHKAQIRDFLADIDPSTGYLREECVRTATLARLTPGSSVLKEPAFA